MQIDNDELRRLLETFFLANGGPGGVGDFVWYRIWLIFEDGSTPQNYPVSETGLTNAIAAVTGADLIIIPGVVTFVNNYTFPDDVSIEAWGGFTKFEGQVTGGDGGFCKALNFSRTANDAGDLVCLIPPATGTVILERCNVSASQSGVGNAYAINNTGAGGLILNQTGVNGSASGGGNGYGIRNTSTGTITLRDSNNVTGSTRPWINTGSGKIITRNIGTNNFIGGGENHTITTMNYGAIAGGYHVTFDGDYSFIGAGATLSIENNSRAVLVGGEDCHIGPGGQSRWSFLGGGLGCYIYQDNYNTLVGGDNNFIDADHYNTLVGGSRNAIFTTGTSTQYNFLGGGNFCFIGDSSYAALGAGINNDIEDSDYAGIFCGSGNTIDTAEGGVIAGGGGIALESGADWSFAGGGLYHEIYAPGATIGAGEYNIIDTDGIYASILGGYRAYADKYGQEAYASGYFASHGDAQRCTYVARKSVAHSDASWYELYLDGANPALLTIPADSVWTFNVLIAGTTQGCTKSFSFRIEGAIENDGGTTTILASTVTTIYDTDDVSFDARVSADDANDALLIEVQDSDGAGDTVRWVANIETAEVRFPA